MQNHLILLPELQGRLPIRVELEALTSDDFKRILREPDFSLIKQYVALLKTENVDLNFQMMELIQLQILL